MVPATITKCEGSQKEATSIETSRLLNSILPIKEAENLCCVTEAQLVSKYSDSVYRFCLSLVYRREDADDLFQDTYLHVLSKIEKINELENPQNFLFSTAASLWKSKKRKFARRNRLAPETEWDDACNCDSEGIEEQVLAEEEILMVRRLVSTLPDKIRIPVIMYYTAEMTVADIAEALKLPVGTVKSHLSRARGIIKKGLLDEYGNE